MKRSIHFRSLLAVFSLGLWLGEFPASAFNPSVFKLHSHATASPAGESFGYAMAMSDRWVIIGSYDNSDKGGSAGAVFVYDAVTGSYLRKLVASDAQAGNAFGYAVALSGNTAVITAVSKNAVYVFDVSTGKQLRQFTEAGITPANGFGNSIALSGNIALVGHDTATEGGNSRQGAVYMYDISTGAKIRKLVASNGATDHHFGFSIAVSGNLALVGANGASSAYVFEVSKGTEQRILTSGVSNDNYGTSVALAGGVAMVGAPNDPETAVNAGAAYVYDVTTGNRLHKLMAADGSRFGFSVALSGSLALTGSPYHDGSKGAAYLHDIGTGTLLHKHTASDGATDDYLGWNVAISGNAAVASALGDDDLGDSSGSAYLFRNLSGPLALDSVAAKGDFAPGTVGANFLAFGEAFVSPSDAVGFVSSLSGAGAGTGGVATGLWSDFMGPTQLIARGTTDLFIGRQVVSLSKPVFNGAADMIFQAVVKGPNITAANDAVVLRNTAGGVPAFVLKENMSPPTFHGGALGTFSEVVQTHDGSSNLATAFLYKLGVGGRTALSDSAVMITDLSGNVLDLFEENSPTGSLPSDANANWGQINPRVAMTGTVMAWSAALKGGMVATANNLGVFKSSGTLSAGTLVARKGSAAPGGGTFSAFTGESVASTGEVLYRATLSGAGVTTATNEGLYLEGYPNPASTGLVARKGDAPDASKPLVRFAKFVKFWPTVFTHGTPHVQAIFLAQLSGTGVSAANDMALYLAQEDGTLVRLLREGDDVEGADGAKVGVIQQVDVNPAKGAYVVVATLTGGAATANLALYTGNSTIATAAVAPLTGLRQPMLRLRKGTMHQAVMGNTTKIKSLSFSNTVDANGAGAKGQGQVIGPNRTMLITIEFDDGAKELMAGRPWPEP